MKLEKTDTKIVFNFSIGIAEAEYLRGLLQNFQGGDLADEDRIERSRREHMFETLNAAIESSRSGAS